MNELVTPFIKDILILEVANPFKFQYADNSNNYIGDSSQILSEFSATPQGQNAYLNGCFLQLKPFPTTKV
ncbi:MAG: hypothetical protein ABIO60_07655 [Aquaticitalea sp.]